MAGSQINEKADKATGNKRVGVSGQSMKKAYPSLRESLSGYVLFTLLLNGLKKEANSKVTA